MSRQYLDNFLCILIAVVLAINTLSWISVRYYKPQWGNVPPVPDQLFASSYGLGDKSFSYRLNGLMIQNLGDTGGRVTSLDDYNYETLAKWFFLQDSLDPKSDFIPYLAAFYFSNVQTPHKFLPVVRYLADVGDRSLSEKWRWLAQAVYLARFKLLDYDLALELAQKLANTKASNIPAWVRQMPAFIMTQRGEKEAAYGLLLEILKSSHDTLHPSEVYNTKIYMCTRLLELDDARENPLCDGIVK